MSFMECVSASASRADVVDRYVEFVAARCRPNTVIATVSDLRVFFAVIDRPPAEVTHGGRVRVHRGAASRVG